MTHVSQPKDNAIGSEDAVKQVVSPDGHCICSFIQNKDGHFRFVVEQLTVEPATSGLPAYSYWEETQQSGLYDSLSAAETEARACLAWLRQRI